MKQTENECEQFEQWHRKTFIKVTSGLQTYSNQNEIEKSATKLGYQAAWQHQQAKIDELLKAQPAQEPVAYVVKFMRDTGIDSAIDQALADKGESK